MAKLIDDTLMLDAMAETILSGAAGTPTAAMRHNGVEDGTADERRLLRKWKDGGAKAMERAARRLLEEAVARHREELSRHGRSEYDRGWEDGRESERDRERMKAWAEMPKLGDRRPSWLSRLFTWAA